MEKIVIIMAGGSGTRLWPLSRENMPKQFICIEDDSCMLVRTIKRACEIVPADRCFIITNRKLFDITLNTVKDLIPQSNIILEPQKKNTAACIAYATLIIKERFGKALLCFVPADGYVRDGERYKEAIELAYNAAEETEDLVIIGITPTYPATGYGYIQIENDEESEKVLSVLKFIEKPDIETAEKLVSSGEFLWNGGILVGSIDTISRRIKTNLPDHFSRLSEAVKHAGEENGTIYVEQAYNEIQSVSFDNGVLEKSKGIHAVRGFFDWDDIGSINALSKTFTTDSDGNSIKGSHVGIATKNSVIVGDDTLITTIGIENMIIASTKDAILICSRDKAQDIKELVEKLNCSGFRNLL